VWFPSVFSHDNCNFVFFNTSTNISFQNTNFLRMLVFGIQDLDMSHIKSFDFFSNSIPFDISHIFSTSYCQICPFAKFI